MRKDSVRLLNDAGEFVRWIDESEARELLRREVATECFEPRPDRTQKFIGLQLMELTDSSASSACISFEEMQLNAGICDEDESQQHIKAVQSKVFWYNKIGDTKNPLPNVVARMN